MTIKEKLDSVDQALYIKLGLGGEFEKECIEKNILKLGYNNINHKYCLQKNWQKIKDYYINDGKTTGTATSHINQIKKFYKGDENVLWITFYNNKLYWCFAEKDVLIQDDNTKIRKVIGQWSCSDLKNNTLFLDDISGRLTKTQGFRSTICSVPEKEYLLKKIKVEQLEEIIEAEKAFNNLKDKIQTLIKKLNPKDFELLVDLIFRNGGWQRQRTIGKTTKSIDITIFHPITCENAVIQVKSQTNLAEFIKYKEIFSGMSNDYDRFFYIAHTPLGDTEKYNTENDLDSLNIYFSDKIAKLVISSGLFDWVSKTVS